MTLRDLKLRFLALLAPRRTDRELDEELAFHLERETQKHIARGLSPADARARALAHFGSRALAAEQCRDAHGVTAIEDVRRDIAYAWRAFRRARLASLTIVTTVAIGLGLIAAVFTFLNVLLFRVAEVRDLHELYGVERPRTPEGDRVAMTRADYEALRRETAVFVDAFAMMSDIDSRIDGRMMAGTLVTGNFFHVLGVTAVLGRPLIPADDQPGAQPVMVLSHRGWSRLFASDPRVIGRTLLVNGIAYSVIGVMPEGFRGLDVGTPDYWAPLARLGEVRPILAGREDRVGLGIVGRLRPGTSPQAALAALAVWDARRLNVRPGERVPVNILLEPRRGTIPQPLEAMVLFTPLFFAFGLILLIGCANVANLLLARAVSRQREIGIRLSLGASRARIIRQLLTEGLLLALAAAVLAFGISRVVLDVGVNALLATLAPELAENIRVAVPAADWRVGLFLVLGAVASTVAFGLVPALQATRLDLLRTMHGDVIRGSPQSRARTVLIAMQVTASTLLLICSSVFLRSALAASTFEPGIRTADTAIVEMINEEVREPMISAVMAEPLVAMTAASWPDPLGRPRAAFATAAGRRSAVAYRLVSPEYFAVLGIDVLQGRGFTAAERGPEAGVVILSQRVARRLWPAGEAVGQVVQLQADPGSPTRREDEPPLPLRTFTIVGVSRDVAGFRFADFEQADVFVPTNAAAAKAVLVVRVHGEPEQARLALLRRLTAIDPSMGQVMTMRTVARMETYFLQIAFWVTTVLGALAVALTLSGLFSVLSYLVEQRTREIGVRLALGATARKVGRYVLAQSVKPVGYGLVIGSGLALGLATVLTATPAASSIAGVVRVFDPLAYAGALLFIVVVCGLAALVPALRAAAIDPLSCLKQD